MWFKFGAKATFLITAGITVLVVIYLSFNKISKKPVKAAA
jgi:hypothetical protein